MLFKLFAVLLLLGLTATFVHGQANFASSTMSLDVPSSFPMFSVSSLHGTQTVQEIDITLIDIEELEFQGELPINYSTLVPGSLVQALDLTWNMNSSAPLDSGVVNLICPATNRPQPSWSSLVLSLSWSNIPTTNWLALNLVVENYQWVNDSAAVTLSFVFGFSSPNMSQSAMPNLTAPLTASFGSLYFSPFANATTTGDPEFSTSPVWLWMNTNTLVVSVGHFQGSMDEEIIIGMNSAPSPPPPPPNSNNFGLDVGIFFVALVVIGVVSIVLVVGGAFYLHSKSRRLDYEPL